MTLIHVIISVHTAGGDESDSEPDIIMTQVCELATWLRDHDLEHLAPGMAACGFRTPQVDSTLSLPLTLP